MIAQGLYHFRFGVGKIRRCHGSKDKHHADKYSITRKLDKLPADAH